MSTLAIINGVDTTTTAAMRGKLQVDDICSAGERVEESCMNSHRPGNQGFSKVVLLSAALHAQQNDF